MHEFERLCPTISQASESHCLPIALMILINHSGVQYLGKNVKNFDLAQASTKCILSSDKNSNWLLPR